MNDDDLQERVARLARSIEPSADLWPGVRRRIAPSPWRRQALALAAALALVVGSSAITVLVMRSRDVDPPPATAAVPVPMVFEAQYVSQASELARLLQRQRDQLAPETIATLERNLAIIDAAIADSRAALAQDPANPDLELLLRAGHQQKVALLEQAARLVRES